MISVIEVKDTIGNTINQFPILYSDFDNIRITMDTLNELLSQDLWKGNAKVKCVYIHGLLEKYCNSIVDLINQLERETIVLQHNMLEFDSNSDSIRNISSI